jgi:hypothetical protein
MHRVQKLTAWIEFDNYELKRSGMIFRFQFLQYYRQYAVQCLVSQTAYERKLDCRFEMELYPSKAS